MGKTTTIEVRLDAECLRDLVLEAARKSTGLAAADLILFDDQEVTFACSPIDNPDTVVYGGGVKNLTAIVTFRRSADAPPAQAPGVTTQKV